MSKTLLIHNDNVPHINKYDDNIKFTNIKHTLEDIQNKEFDILYIKDSLSSNYMEFMGLVLAYHIRLTTALENKRYLPIVIISDLDIVTLNKITPLAKILFTKNIFFNQLPNRYTPLNEENFKKEFLEKIEVERPKDISGEHDIANQWSIYKWSAFIGASSDVIAKNRSQVEGELIFQISIGSLPYK